VNYAELSQYFKVFAGDGSAEVLNMLRHHCGLTTGRTVTCKDLRMATEPESGCHSKKSNWENGETFGVACCLCLPLYEKAE